MASLPAPMSGRNWMMRRMVINSADDERNPTELGVLEAQMPRLANGEVYVIPSSPQTTGHGTTGGQAELYAQQLEEFLKDVPGGR